MALTLVWSLEAVEDLEIIADFIARDSDFYAASVVSSIIKTAVSIPAFPFIGRVVPEINDNNIRERIVFNYRLVYQIKDNAIVIVAILHGKRQIDNVSERLE